MKGKKYLIRAAHSGVVWFSKMRSTQLLLLMIFVGNSFSNSEVVFEHNPSWTDITDSHLYICLPFSNCKYSARQALTATPHVCSPTLTPCHSCVCTRDPLIKVDLKIVSVVSIKRWIRGNTLVGIVWMANPEGQIEGLAKVSSLYNEAWTRAPFCTSHRLDLKVHRPCPTSWVESCRPVMSWQVRRDFDRSLAVVKYTGHWSRLIWSIACWSSSTVHDISILWVCKLHCQLTACVNSNCSLSKCASSSWCLRSHPNRCRPRMHLSPWGWPSSNNALYCMNQLKNSSWPVHILVVSYCERHKMATHNLPPSDSLEEEPHTPHGQDQEVLLQDALVDLVIR